MNDNNKNTRSPEEHEAVEKALSVTRADIAEYFTSFEKQHGDMLCPLFKTSLWAITPRIDSDEHAAIITLPLPNASGRGVWAYPIICSGCGYIIHLSASFVVGKIKGE